MEGFVTIVNSWNLLTIAARLSTLDVWRGPGYASVIFQSLEKNTETMQTYLSKFHQLILWLIRHQLGIAIIEKRLMITVDIVS